MIDLIIPFYNEEDNLDQLMGSICAQTKKHGFMVTFVNDHSTDDSVVILERWKQFVPFPMQIITPPEKLTYPGLVRQYGIDHTRNEYIMFCDGDDALLPQAIETLSDEIRMSNMDLVASHFIQEGELEDTVKDLKQGGFTWLHGNIYRRKFLEENNIHFRTGYNEDGTFNLWCILSTDKLKECKKQTYLWRNNDKSITRTRKFYSRDCFEDIIWGYKSDYVWFLEQHPDLLSKEELSEEEEKLIKKYWTNCLGHLGLFYKWINEFCIYDTPQGRLDEIMKLIKDFAAATKIKELLNIPEVSDFYKNLIVQLSPKLTYLTLNDYLNLLDIHCDLRPKELIEKFGGDLS